MTTSLICDASVALRYLFVTNEQTHYQQLWDNWLQQGVQIYAPALWMNEVVSGLSKAIYFKQMTPDEAEKLLSMALQLPIEIITPTPLMAQTALQWTIQEKRKRAYDSFYVVLAQHMGCELWTADKKLVNAVNQSWVKWAGST